MHSRQAFIIFIFYLKKKEKLIQYYHISNFMKRINRVDSQYYDRREMGLLLKACFLSRQASIIIVMLGDLTSNKGFTVKKKKELKTALQLISSVV